MEEKEIQESDYAIIKLPRDLADMIDKMMGRMGYRTRTEFVKDAIRNLLQQYGISEERAEPLLTTQRK